MPSTSMPITTPNDRAEPAAGPGLRARLREFALASILGAAVIIWPGDSSAERRRWARPPAYVRVLRWRDIVKLRLAPWLLMQDEERASRKND